MLEDLKHLQSKLKDKNIILLIKLHFRNLDMVDSLEQKLNNVIFIRDENINQDIYTILNYTDFLITDYSSTYTDYLLLDKPIIFYIKGLNEFLKDEESLLFNYWEVTPGPKAENWEQLVGCMEEAVKYPDKYKEDRKKVRKIFHKYNDAKSCERVFNSIVDNLSE